MRLPGGDIFWPVWGFFAGLVFGYLIMGGVHL